MTKGVVIKLYGDQQIAGAIADGMTRALDAQSIEVVKREIHEQRVQRSLLRVAVGNTRTAQDYSCMVAKAKGDYSDAHEHGRLYGAVLGVWALFWLAVHEAYDYFSAWNREA